MTTKKFALLPYLMRNAGRRLTRAMIIEHVWNLNFDSTTNVVDVYINDLRRKVDDGFTPSLIHIVRGVGYQVSHEGRRQKGRGHECREDAVATPASQPSRASSNRQGPTDRGAGVSAHDLEFLAK